MRLQQRRQQPRTISAGPQQQDSARSLEQLEQQLEMQPLHRRGLVPRRRVLRHQRKTKTQAVRLLNRRPRHVNRRRELHQLALFLFLFPSRPDLTRRC